MEKWYLICALLCLVGVLKEFRPSEPYVTKFLVNYKNVTRDTVMHVVYPIATYSYLGTMPLIFLITDLVRYKAVVIFECLAFVTCYVMLIWGEGLTNLKILEVLYGTANSAEVAYFTYIYAKVKKEEFKKVTSYIHTALILGNLVAATAAQLLVSTNTMNIRELNFLTLGSCVAALLFSCFLPSVDKSLYFHRSSSHSSTINNNSINQEDGSICRRNFVTNTLGVLWKDFKHAYSNAYILKWSIWWAIASAGNYMVRNYVQALWEDIAADSKIYNGAVDAVHTLLSAIFALSIGYTRIPWEKYGEPFLSVMCFIQGLLLFWMAVTDSLMIAYANYIVFRVSFQVMITVASAEVAMRITLDSYGLIFGINRFMALVFQTILTLVITDKQGFAMSERDQFLAYGSYHTGLGVFFAVASILLFRRNFANSARAAMGRNSVAANDKAQEVEIEAQSQELAPLAGEA